MPVGYAVYFYHRGQRAAAKSGGAVNRKEPVLVGIGVHRDLQMPFYRVGNKLGPLYMAGGSVADLDKVLPDLSMPKMGVEG